MSMDRAAATSAEAKLAEFIAKFSPEHQRLIRAARKAMQKRLPTAHELVYDNYNFFVIGYGASARSSHAILSIAAGANGVSLCFLQGARIADPERRLLGEGKQTRFLRLPSAATLAEPVVEALLAAAVAGSAVPFPTSGKGQLKICSVSAKQRPRRKEPATGATSPPPPRSRAAPAARARGRA